MSKYVTVACRNCQEPFLASRWRMSTKRKYPAAYCSVKCSSGHATSSPAEGRFWAKVDKRGPAECWLWMGSKHERGYGQLWLNGKIMRAHRFSWELVNGPFPEGMKACHRCDTPSCVNPSHIFLGSDLDNSRDCIEKGRHLSKLTVEKVSAIKRLVRKHGDSTAIARLLGVSTTAIRSIARGKTWRDVS